MAMTDPPSVSPENRAIPSPQGDKKMTGSKYVWVQPTGFIQHLLFHIFYLSFPLTSAISKVPVVKFYFLRNLLTSCVLKLNFITIFFSIFSICHCFIFHPSPQVFLEPLKEIQQMAHLQHVDVNKIFCNVQDLCEVKPVGHFGFLYTNSTPNIPHFKATSFELESWISTLVTRIYLPSFKGRKVFGFVWCSEKSIDQSVRYSSSNNYRQENITWDTFVKET